MSQKQISAQIRLPALPQIVNNQVYKITSDDEGLALNAGDCNELIQRAGMAGQVYRYMDTDLFFAKTEWTFAGEADAIPVWLAVEDVEEGRVFDTYREENIPMEELHVVTSAAFVVAFMKDVLQQNEDVRVGWEVSVLPDYITFIDMSLQTVGVACESCEIVKQGAEEFVQYLFWDSFLRVTIEGEMTAYDLQSAQAEDVFANMLPN